MNGEKKDIFQFWAKYGQSSDKKWHSVVTHCLDVAMCALVLIESSPYFKKRLNRAVGLKGKDLVEFFCFFVALHDLGKISPAFQYKKEEFCQRFKDKYPNTGDTTRHEAVSRYLLLECNEDIFDGPAGPKIIEGHVTSENISDLRELINLLSLHHGHFHIAQTGKDSLFCHEEWVTAQRSLVKFFFELFRPSGIPFKINKINLRACVDILGFMIESDWLGSNEIFFPFEFNDADSGELDIPKYLIKAKESARKQLDFFNLHKTLEKKINPTFEELFGFQARGIQKYIYKTSINFECQFSILINSETGGGKTELAVFLSENSNRRGEVFTLPSQASANGIYDRRVNYVNRLHKDSKNKINVELAHQKRLFVQAREDVLKNWERYKNHEEFTEASVSTDFFSDSKRALFAPYCITTLDQVSMMGLRVKHSLLRAYAIAGKTVIIDEIHAFSLYSQEHIYNTIRWLRKLECNIIVLSATISSFQKEKLLEAMGASVEDVDLKRYPSIILCQKSKTKQAKGIKAFRKINVKIDKVKSVNAAIDKLSPFMGLKDFRCVFFCNIVAECQQIHDRIKSKFNMKDDEIICINSKEPAFQRLEFEDILTKRFGEKPEDRRGRLVLVATQACEQSLNFDCDLMITYLCPIDFFLQRIGRLHRFPTIERPLGLEYPTVIVIDTSDENFGKSAKIYPPFILRKTMDVLNKLTEIVIPRDCQKLVDKVYPKDMPQCGKSWYENEFPDVDETSKEYEEACYRFSRSKEIVDAKTVLVSPKKPLGIIKEIEAIVNDVDEDDLESVFRRCPKKKRLVLLFSLNGKLYLTPDGKGLPIDLNSKPKRIDIRDMMKSMVDIYLYEFFLCSQRHPQPQAWEEISSLRNTTYEIFYQLGPKTFRNKSGDKHFVFSLEVGLKSYL